MQQHAAGWWGSEGTPWLILLVVPCHPPCRWKEGARNTMESGGKKVGTGARSARKCAGALCLLLRTHLRFTHPPCPQVNENKALSKKKQWAPYSSKCTVGAASLHWQQVHGGCCFPALAASARWVLLPCSCCPAHTPGIWSVGSCAMGGAFTRATLHQTCSVPYRSGMQDKHCQGLQVLPGLQLPERSMCNVRTLCKPSSVLGWTFNGVWRGAQTLVQVL